MCVNLRKIKKIKFRKLLTLMLFGFLTYPSKNWFLDRLVSDKFYNGFFMYSKWVRQQNFSLLTIPRWTCVAANCFHIRNYNGKRFLNEGPCMQTKLSIMQTMFTILLKSKQLIFMKNMFCVYCIFPLLNRWWSRN